MARTRASQHLYPMYVRPKRFPKLYAIWFSREYHPDFARPVAGRGLGVHGTKEAPAIPLHLKTIYSLDLLGIHWT